jgi:hypothetical protein
MARYRSRQRDDAALRWRGSLTVWFTDAAIRHWTMGHKAPSAPLPQSGVTSFDVEALWRMSAR